MVKFNYSLWAYVFMPDHVHLIIYPNAPVYNVSDFLKAVKEPVSRKAVHFSSAKRPTGLRIRVRRGSREEHHFW
jgi:putative transposase